MESINPKLPYHVDGEPDFYRSYYKGYKIAIVRNTMGVLCGYVKIPRNHKFYRKNYWGLPIDVHGGLTYSGEGPTGKSYRMRGHWIGFDCGHYMDYIPVLMKVMQSDSAFKTKYRDFEYVLDQVHQMVDQVIRFKRRK